MTKFVSVFVDKVEVNDKKSSDDFLYLYIEAICSSKNVNNSVFLEESFSDGIKTCYNKPILAYYDPETDDLQEHNYRIALDENGEIFNDFQYNEAERICGAIPESAEIYTKIRDDKTWLIIDGAIVWIEYNKQLVDLLKKYKRKSVSVEIEVLDSDIDEDGVERIKAWKLLGITILGDNYDPAIKGAHLRVKKFSESSEFEDYKKRLTYAFNKKANIFNKYFGKVQDVDGKGGRIELTLSNRELEDRAWAALSGYTYIRDGYTNHKYWVEDIYTDENVVIARDNENNEFLKIPYHVDNDGKFHLNISEMKPTRKRYESQNTKDRNIEVFLSKSEWGTGKSLTVNKSADSISDTKWSDISKTDLRNNILKAKNYKTIVKSVYLLVEDGWEEAPAPKLKYPVMEIKDGELVYNSNALLSAQQYGEKNDKIIANKAKRLRDKLGLDKMKDEDKVMNFMDAAEANGLFFFGLFDDEYYFLKKSNTSDKVYDCDKNKAQIYSIKSDKIKECDFSWDKLELKNIKMSKFDDEGSNNDDDNYNELKEELKKVLKEKDDLEDKYEEVVEELEEMKSAKFKEDTDAILSDEDSDIDEKIKEELTKERDGGKFVSVEDFMKEMAFKMLMKKQKARTYASSLTFGLDTKNRNFSAKVSNPDIDELDKI